MVHIATICCARMFGQVRLWAAKSAVPHLHRDPGPYNNKQQKYQTKHVQLQASASGSARGEPQGEAPPFCDAS
eukprot:10555234-Heterocapsa_arctica.AAC.1